MWEHVRSDLTSTGMTQTSLITLVKMYPWEPSLNSLCSILLLSKTIHTAKHEAWKQAILTSQLQMIDFEVFAFIGFF